MKQIIYTIIFLFLVSTIWAQESGDILIKNGTVLTVTNGTMKFTDILIKDGKINAIGENVKPGQNGRA